MSSGSAGSDASPGSGAAPGLGPTELQIDRQAPARRIELDGGSWVDLVEGYVPDASRHLHELRDGVAWQQGEVLRYDRYVPERRLVAGVAAERHALLRQSELHLQSRYRVSLQGVAALLYRDGADFQGLHSDRELRWLDDTIVAIVVLGVRRPFVLRRRVPLAQLTERTPAGRQAGDVVLTPGVGDLLVMGGACQRDWLHGVPEVDAADARLSLTWRWTSRRGRPDTNPGYYEGRQFAGAPRRAGYRHR